MTLYCVKCRLGFTVFVNQSPCYLNRAVFFAAEEAVGGVRPAVNDRTHKMRLVKKHREKLVIELSLTFECVYDV